MLLHDNTELTSPVITLKAFSTISSIWSLKTNTSAINTAKEAIVDPYITPVHLAELVLSINEAYNNLKLREITVKDADTNALIITGNSLSLNSADYFDTKELSSVTYGYESLLTVSVVDGVYTIDTTGMELGLYTVTLKALYKEEVKQIVVITVEVIAEPTVTVKEEELVFIDVPLLYELNLTYMFNKIIFVYVDEDKQIERLKEIDRISSTYAREKIIKQIPMEKKREMAKKNKHFILENNTGVEETYKKLDEILKEIKHDI